jgi:peptide/nickel transport system permease protein
VQAALIFTGLIVALFALAWVLRAGLARGLRGHTASLVRDMPLTAAFGATVIALYILIGLFAPVLAPYPEREVVGGQFLPWTSDHVFGTDRLGRDMLSRMIYGARNTVGIAFLTTRWPSSWGRRWDSGRRSRAAGPTRSCRASSMR